MTGYRRLISYIYGYEGEVKGKNIGFVKLESRNGQCRLSANVKKVYVGNSDLGVYLLYPGGEQFLGNIFIRNGSGEFRALVPAEGENSMEGCFGLTIHEKGDSWRSYTTIWEDAVSQAAEVELAELTSRNLADPALQLRKKLEELNRELETEPEILEPEPALLEAAAPAIEEQPEPIPEPIPVTEPESIPEPTPVTEPERIPEPTPVTGPERIPQPVPVTAPERIPQPIPMTEPERIPQPTPVTEPEPVPQPAPVEEPTPARPHSDLTGAKGADPIFGNFHRLEQLEAEEAGKGESPEELWQSFRRQYPKIQDFESQGEVEILTIRPRDIGLLPRENWRYGNNSFLLHGYYNYRYLIVARAGDGTRERTRYILGVPGHYYSNEKYMASMFGFPYFVLSKKQPAEDGRFGYWYTDLYMDDMD